MSLKEESREGIKGRDAETIGIFFRNPLNSRLLAEFLEDVGYRVIVSSNDDFCADEFGNADLIICDVHCCSRFEREILSLKEVDDFLPVVVAIPKNSDSGRWLNSGFDDIVGMPISKEMLVHRFSLLLKLRKQTQELSERHKALFRSIVEQSLVGIALIDKDGFVYSNDAMKRMFKSSVEGPVSVDEFFEFIETDDVQNYVDVFEQLLSGDIPSYRDILRFKGLGDETTFIELLAKGVDLDRGRGVIIAGVDISERKRLEEQLLISQKMEAIGKLAGGVAHDFNNILTVIMGNSELLLNTCTLDERAYRDVEEIKRSAEKAAALTERLLVLSRRKIEKVSLVDVNEIISDMQRMLERLMGEDIDIIIDTFKGIWKVKADPSTIEQIILNMAVNAREAMPDGGAFIVKTANEIIAGNHRGNLADLKDGDYVVLRFIDTGVGMNKETMKRIFEPFFTKKSGKRGTGLGLSIVYSIVKQYGGYIDVRSKPGEGSEFIIYLPRSNEDVERDVEPNETAVDFDELKGRGERVLVVEDEESVRSFTTDILRQSGYEVFAAATAADAVSLLRRERSFDLILSDVVLPDMNGVDLLRRLSNMNKSMKLVLTSGYTDEKSKFDEIRREGFDFIQKPFKVVELLSLIRKVLAKTSI